MIEIAITYTDGDDLKSAEAIADFITHFFKTPTSIDQHDKEIQP